jgi:hypothetical protein
MNLYQILRFLRPMQNPLGFDLTDFLALGFAALAVGAILTGRKNEAILRWIAERPVWAMALLAALPIVLRLCLLGNHPVPVPAVSDDFAYLLLGDTLAHFRLANPVHPMHRFFETVFVLQEPSYSSIYPAGQGIVLALGQLVCGLPWAGVLVSVGVFCALVYWMLRAWVTPVWALVGGLLAVMLFGPLNQWTNNYWGGAVSGIAGCLVFGSIPRRKGVPLGIGLALQILTRPFEAVLLTLCVPWRRFMLPAILALLPALCLTAIQNKAVTGDWTKLPYMLSREQYGIPASFTFQKMPEPHRQLTQEQALDYQAQKDVHDSSGNFWVRWAGRLRFLRFFLLPPLFVAILRQKWRLWVVYCVVLFSLGTNFYPYFYPHYVAAVACLLLLMAVTGLARLYRPAARLVLLLCAGHFMFWYGLHLLGNQALFEATGPYESWDYINFGDAEGRMAVDTKLTQSPGKQLVFVRYSARHLLREWVRNAADIDGSRVVWALDLGPEEDAKLMAYYPQRTAWVVEPDSVPPRLTSYRPER